MCNVTMTYVICEGREGGGGGSVGRAIIADCIRQYVPLATGLLCIQPPIHQTYGRVTCKNK